MKAHSIAKFTRELAAPMGAQQPQRVTQMSKQEPELTDWYPGSVCPVRPGIYQRDYSDNGNGSDASWCRFDGDRWYSYEEDKSAAMLETVESSYQLLPWRGLTKESK